MKAQIFLVVFSLVFTASLKAGNLYTSLLEVNDRWAYEHDLPGDIFLCNEAEDPVQTHLLRVHEVLSARSVEHVAPALQERRKKSLSVLREYALDGAFPNNLLHKGRRPVFIGPNGNYCAVGYLIKESGRDDLARKISRNMNYEYLLNMEDEELLEWVEKSGFTAEELAWIQPAYNAYAPFVKMDTGTDAPVQAIIAGDLAGEIVVAGSFDQAGSTHSPGIAQWKQGFAGYGWTGFGTGAVEYEVLDLAYYNGGMVAAGNIYTADTVSVLSGVAFWDGTTWSNMGQFYVGALMNTVLDVEVYNGELYAGGFFRSPISSPSVFTHLAKWNGTEWEGVGGFINGRVSSLHVHDGKLIIGGDFTTIDSVAYNHIAAYDGNSFSSLGPGVPLPVYALETHGDTLFAGGEFIGPAAVDTFGLAYFHDDQWHRILGNMSFVSLQNQRIQCLESTPYGLFIGGNVSYPDWGTIGRNLLRYTQGQISAYAVLDSTVHSLSYDPDMGHLFVGGDFSAGEFKHITYVDIAAQFSTGEKTVIPSRLYPNPSRDQFSVDFDHAVPEIRSYGLYDISGKAYSLELERRSPSSLHFSFGNIPDGVYSLNISTREGEVCKKVVIR